MTLPTSGSIRGPTGTGCISAGPGERGQARRRVARGVTLSYMEDVVTLDVRDDRSGFVVNGGGGGERQRDKPGPFERARLRPDRDVAAGDPAGRAACDRVRTGRGHGGVGQACPPSRWEDPNDRLGGDPVHQRGHVKTHVLYIFAKLGVTDRAAAVAVGFERGLLPLAQTAQTR
jgi:hypothetical protein